MQKLTNPPGLYHCDPNSIGGKHSRLEFAVKFLTWQPGVTFLCCSCMCLSIRLSFSITRFSVSRCWLDSRRELTERTRPAEAEVAWLLWLNYIWTHTHSLPSSVSPSLCLNCFGVLLVLMFPVQKCFKAPKHNVFTVCTTHTVHICSMQNNKVKQTYIQHL